MLLWIVFAGAVTALLALDLGVIHRRPPQLRCTEALGWSAVWLAAALLFMGGVYLRRGAEHGLSFLAGYLVEWSLSADNVFIFLMLFSYFRVPPASQHKVLFWGIIGAVIMRGILITTGIALIRSAHWIVYLFGGFLAVTGVRMALKRDEAVHPEKNPVFRLVRRVLPMTSDYRGDRFFVRESGAWMITPLFLVLAVVESTDIAFAVDSVPAVLAITTDPFVVYTSNIFAILGLRSLYFVLAGIMPMFHYLKYGLAVILVFVGAKMVLSDVLPIATHLALGVVAVALVGTIGLSLLLPPPAPPPRQEGQ